MGASLTHTFLTIVTIGKLVTSSVRSFNVDRTMMELFYKSYIEPVLSFSISCWFGNLSVKHKNALNRIVTLSGKIIGKEQRSLSFLFNRNVLSRGPICAPGQ